MGEDVFDIIIVGAGVSGISAGVHVKTRCPEKSFVMLEARGAIGGTWDLFKYPGIRSDSDMHTFGFSFKPWTEAKAIADGPNILRYLQETVEEYGLSPHIRFGHKMVAADWSSAKGLWTVTSESGETVSGKILYIASGYYSYEDPHNPELPGEAAFSGPIIHPQLWDETLDYADKNVAVIGSGATAVTLVPNLTDKARHVSMVQRSPTYMFSRPSKDWIANTLKAVLPRRWAYALTRFKNIRLQDYIFKKARRNPEDAKTFIMDKAQKSLGPDYPVQTHFNPDYYPWEQRLCLIPDDDLYEVIKAGQASIATGHIETLTEDGITLKTGETVKADVIIKATGLNVQIMSDAKLSLDGTPVNFPDHFTYEAMMYSDIPNFVSVFGYVNASWTLRADLIADFTCRMMQHMDAGGYDVVTPRAPEGMTGKPWITIFNPGYINRVIDRMPMQGDRDPWLNHQDYLRDKKVLPKMHLHEALEYQALADMADAA